MSQSDRSEHNREFPNQMLKEVYEQPEAIRQTILQHIDSVTHTVRPDRFPWTSAEVASLRRVTIVASGASRHAGLCGKLMIEDLAGIPVEVEHASEYGYRKPTNGKGSLVIAITQSGETADTTAAQRIAKENGMKTLSISNVVDSTISREADANFFTRAGREVAIPATKSFTTQLTALYMLALFLAAQKGTLTAAEVTARVEALSTLPDLIEQSLDRFNAEAKIIARDFYHDTTFVFLGRGVHYPIALEGALKLKEISYVHAEGYPTGEFRHGPTALITESLPVVAIVTSDRRDPGIDRALRKVDFPDRRHSPDLQTPDTAGVRRRRNRAGHGRRFVLSPPPRRIAAADHGSRAAAVPRLPHRGAEWPRRGPSPQPGQVGGGGLKPVS